MAVSLPKTSSPTSPESRALEKLFAKKGYKRCLAEPEMLLPTDLFLDHAGRDVRALFFMLADSAGREFYLRPDFTVPICRDYVADLKKKKNLSRRLFYMGSVFRVSKKHPRRAEEASKPYQENMQIGIENLGAKNRARADAQIVILTQEALRARGVKTLSLQFGDPGLFDALVEDLEISVNWKGRLKRLFRLSREALPALLDDAERGKVRPSPNPENEVLFKEMRRVSSEEAETILRRHLQAKSITHQGARPLSEIAQGVREQAVLSAPAPALPQEMIATLKRFLKIETPASQALEKIAEVAPRSRSFQKHLMGLEKQCLEMEKTGINLKTSRFRATFYGGLGYYTGFVFSFVPTLRRPSPILATGGRYDGFLRALGAPQDASGVGAALYLSEIARLKPKSPKAKSQAR